MGSVTHLVDRQVVEGNGGGSVTFCRERLSRDVKEEPFHRASTFETEATCIACLARAVAHHERRAFEATCALDDLRTSIARQIDTAEEIRYAEGHRSPYISKLVHASDLQLILDGVLR